MKPLKALENCIVLIDKPVGQTSFDVLSRVKKITGIKKAGHAGTLDRLASGLLVVCTGKATRLATWLITDDKEYEAVVKLGIKTETDDRDGEIIQTRSTAGVTEENIRETASRFVGVQMQKPPQYSALKINGKRASDRIRKGGDVDLKEREIHIYSLVPGDIAADSFSIKVSCSKGTYIRALARDMGEALGCGAHLDSLRRTRSGLFYIGNAVTIDELEGFCRGDKPGKAFCKRPVEALRNYSSMIITGPAVKRVLNGGFFNKDDVLSHYKRDEKKYIILDKEENLIAIADIDTEIWHINYNAVLGLKTE